MAKSYKPTKLPLVKEPAIAYKKAAHPLRAVIKNTNEAKPKIAHWLGGNSLMAPITTEFDLINASEAGIAKASVDELANFLGISRKFMAEDIFDLSVKTLERKSPKDKMDKRTSAHAIEIAKLMQHAYDVFEDEEKMKQWVNKENKALKGKKPVALFNTLTGLNMVNDVLGRIEEGVYS